MDYTRVKVCADVKDLESIAVMLLDKGISGVELQEPGVYADFLNKRSSYDWDYIDPSVENLSGISPSITFYLEDSLQGIGLLEDVLEDIRVFHIDKIEIAGASDEDWKDKWKQYFKPTRITDRFVVKPSWEPYEKKPDELVIEIDPGMAFGTGAHSTTKLCIRLLEKYLNNERKTVLDMGCGSGVLAIASALLGAKKVLGVEIDPVAVEIAKKNIAANNLLGNVDIIQGDLTKGIEYKADVLAANLTADLIISLLKDASEHLNKNGIVIVSGILQEKEDEVVSAFIDAKYHILDMLKEEEWCAMAAALNREERK
ncbi:MAG TPA: 50S ribosomal protein L11 methyltransferase [Bacillota bacterium]|nr:50S ribosomal protein L11 methyltransferase [Bacillota bacterium]